MSILKKLSISTVFFALVSFSSANAGGGHHHGVVDSSSHNVVRTKSGGCLHTKWKDHHDDCHGYMSHIIPDPVSTIYFKFNDHSLDDRERAKLDNLISRVRHTDRILSVYVVGHADRIGKSSSNYVLSKHRAKTVKNYLMNRGVKAYNIDMSAVGENRPMAKCSDTLMKDEMIACLKKDRRVDVMIEYEYPDNHVHEYDHMYHQNSGVLSTPGRY